MSTIAHAPHTGQKIYTPRRSENLWQKSLEKLSSALSFGTPDIPDRLIVKPIDPWPGSAEEGRQICAQSHDLRSGNLQNWPQRLHRFFWLRDLRTMGGEDARHCAKDMVLQWIMLYGNKPKTADHKHAWRADITGERITNWISHYDFIESCNHVHDEHFHGLFFDSLYKQARVLSRKIPHGCHGVALFKSLKGLLYAGLAFEGHEAWIEQALGLIIQESDKQILSDGMHISRSPLELMRVLQIFLDIKTALAAGDYPLPEQIQHTIDRMGPALQFFRYGDKHLAVMNGAQKGDPALLDSILAQAGTRSKTIQSLPEGGYERLTMGRTLIMFDGGAAPAHPYDSTMHAAPLSFELCYGKDRIFTACGSHPSFPDWQEALRATAAHTALCLDNRNACEIKPDGHFARKAKTVQMHREDTKEAIFLEASHDGYAPLNGMTHKRCIFMTGKGYDIRGEETLTAIAQPSEPIDIAVRFHIHPRVLVSLIQDGTAALLRLPGGIGWRFEHSAGLLALEDSIYLGEGTEPRKTNQLVIYGQTSEKEAKIKWKLGREGI